jgi:hypothetical protein
MRSGRPWSPCRPCRRLCRRWWTWRLWPDWGWHWPEPCDGGGLWSAGSGRRPAGRRRGHPSAKHLLGLRRGSGWCPLAILRWRRSLRGILLKGCEGGLSGLEVTFLQCLTELIEQALPLSPPALLGGLDGTNRGRNTHVRQNFSLRAERNKALSLPQIASLRYPHHGPFHEIQVKISVNTG